MDTRLRLVGAALAAGMLAFAPGAAAQGISRTDPLATTGDTDRAEAIESEARELVRECLERMATITRHTCERITRISWDGVARLRALAAQGAPDEALIRSARESVDAMGAATAEGRERVNLTARACLERLEEIGAAPIHARVVLEGRERSLALIHACLREGSHRVRRALVFLTSDALPISPIAG